MTISDTAANTPETELSLHGTYASITRGTSMRPLFKTHRDMVILERPTSPLKKYDVVLYRVGDNYILHRIIGEKGDFYVIRGDNTFRREYVSKDKIIGVLVAFNRKGKRGNVTDRGFKVYSRLWHYMYPVRLLFRFFYLCLRGVYRLFFKRKNKEVA